MQDAGVSGAGLSGWFHSTIDHKNAITSLNITLMVHRPNLPKLISEGNFTSKNGFINIVKDYGRDSISLTHLKEEKCKNTFSSRLYPGFNNWYGLEILQNLKLEILQKNA